MTVSGVVTASGVVATAPGVVETAPSVVATTPGVLGTGDAGHVQRSGDVEASIVDIEITIIHIV
jgi:hypothetical protein